jgi:hypothetical protein
VTGELVRELECKGIGYELLLHRQTTTAGEEAAALCLPREQVVKTLVLVTAAPASLRRPAFLSLVSYH